MRLWHLAKAICFWVLAVITGCLAIGQPIELQAVCFALTTACLAIGAYWITRYERRI